MSPNYYAAGRVKHEYEVAGRGLLLIPGDAVGILANRNDNPLEFIDNLNPIFYTKVVDRSDERLVLVQSDSSSYVSPYFLGAIVSSDRRTVYWVNRSNPLPE